MGSCAYTGTQCDSPYKHDHRHKQSHKNYKCIKFLKALKRRNINLFFFSFPFFLRLWFSSRQVYTGRLTFKFSKTDNSFLENQCPKLIRASVIALWIGALFTAMAETMIIKPRLPKEPNHITDLAQLLKLPGKVFGKPASESTPAARAGFFKGWRLSLGLPFRAGGQHREL